MKGKGRYRLAAMEGVSPGDETGNTVDDTVIVLTCGQLAATLAVSMADIGKC